MTVSSTAARQTYIGDGSTATYPYNFKIFAPADLVLVKRDTSTGVETFLAYLTDYTVTGAGAAAGGTFTLLAGVLPSGYALAAYRVVDLLQLTDLRNQGSFLPEVHERVFDRLVMIAQQLQDQLNRSIRFPDSEAGGSATKIPTKERRAGGYLAFDANGDPMASTGVAGVAVSAFAQTLVDDLSAADARATLLIAGIVTPEQHGAVGNGTADDTAAFTAALTAAGTSGAALWLDGRKTYAISDLAVPAGSVIHGNRALLKRNGGTVALLDCDIDCVVMDVRIDGQKATYTGSAKRGITFDSGCKIVRCEVYDCGGQGIRGLQAGTNLERAAVLDCVSYNNGTNPGASGTGDGIYMQNALDCLVQNCTCYGNARSGIVATTSNAGTPDATFSYRVRLIANNVYDNSYNDINCEYVSQAQVIACRAKGQLSFSNSPDMQVIGHRGALIYSDGGHRPHISDFHLESAAGNLLYLTGNSPVVRGGYVKSTGTPSGASIDIQPADSIGIVTDIEVENCLTGFQLLGVTHANNLKVKGTVTTAFKIGANVTDLVRIENGKKTIRDSAAPVTGTWAVGDVCLHSTPTAVGFQGWVCTTAGTDLAAVWTIYGRTELLGSTTYDPPSLADGAGTTTTVTVTGATLGDFADVSFSRDLQGISVTAYVSAADTVSVRFQNETGGTIDLASGTLRVKVRGRASA